VERNADGLAVILWKKAFPEINHTDVVDELMGHSFTRHIGQMPVLAEREVVFNQEYTYKRQETLNFFINQESRDEENPDSGDDNA
jgi:hypothetical protein